MNRRVFYVKEYPSGTNGDEAEADFVRLIGSSDCEMRTFVSNTKGFDGRIMYSVYTDFHSVKVDHEKIYRSSVDIIKSGAREDLNKPCDLELWLKQKGFELSK